MNNSIENMIEMGADYYVSIDVEGTDSQNFASKYEVVEQNESYIIIDLNKPLNRLN